MEKVKALLLLLEGWERISMDKETFILSWFLGKGFKEKVKTLLLY